MPIVMTLSYLQKQQETQTQSPGRRHQSRFVERVPSCVHVGCPLLLHYVSLKKEEEEELSLYIQCRVWNGQKQESREKDRRWWD